MIAADATVWIDYFNGAKTPYIDRFRFELNLDNVVVTDVILVEVLQGFRNDKDYEKAVSILNDVNYRSFWGRRHMQDAASNYRLLRKHGVTIRKPNDVVVGTFCLKFGYSLIHHDRDFDFMKQLLGLRIINPYGFSP
jgi:predicted nucleic acid-binding protein